MPGNGFGEFDLIRRLERLTAAPFASSRHILLGIGDDAAVLKQTRGHLWLATTDLLAEHIHFDLTYTSYDKLGYKAAAVNFSDIAAMGGMPRFILVAMALSRHQTPRDVENLYRGIQSACQDVGAIVVGGDTSASKKDLFLAVTVLGEAPSRNILRRSGARPGDHVYVTGSLGDARAGLEILREGPKRFDEGNRSAKGLSYLTRRHLSPHPRLKEGRCLAQNRIASAAIDLSDGLAGDLRHICEESGVGALIDTRRIPISSALARYAEQRRRNALEYALPGGEDYELLFTVPVSKVTRMEALIRGQRVQATNIGIITKANRLMAIGRDGVSRPLRVKSYEHRLYSPARLT